MSFSFHDDDDADGADVNLDELYEKKQQADLYRVELYNKLLSRIHSKIKLTSRRSKTEQYCWYLVPEVMIGAPRFDHGDCVAYLVDKLRNNGFAVTYTHPNLMFVSWQHWIPGYVRQEIKKKTGQLVDGMGNRVEKKSDQEAASGGGGKKGVSFLTNMTDDPNELLFQKPGKDGVGKVAQKEYKSVDSYKPTGHLGYTEDVLRSLSRKLS